MKEIFRITDRDVKMELARSKYNLTRKQLEAVCSNLPMVIDWKVEMYKMLKILFDEDSGIWRSKNE